jgi:hypothetical protein
MIPNHGHTLHVALKSHTHVINRSSKFQQFQSSAVFNMKNDVMLQALMTQPFPRPKALGGSLGPKHWVVRLAARLPVTEAGRWWRAMTSLWVFKKKRFIC